MFEFIPRPDYTKSQFKRLYSIYRQLRQSQLCKHKPRDFFHDIFEAKSSEDETQATKRRVRLATKYNLVDDVVTDGGQSDYSESDED